MSDADPIRSQLDAYLDGLLDEEDRRAFEERLESDETLRREVELQRRIDENLRSRFGPPGRVGGTEGMEPRIASVQKGSGPRWVKVGAVAALLLLSVLAWYGVIRPNLFWALGYNTVAIPFAAAGRLNPMIASAAMAMSSVSVLSNSLRLQQAK